MILRSATSRQLLAATGVSLLALTAATPALAQYPAHSRETER